ncbi:DUF2442 domain-containing protein [Klebsiella variicola]|nr:DUF2442 domain-containing protein [Klebsiella variicola]
MPVILRINGFRFFFYSNEGNPLEPAHIHVMKAGSEAKFWLTPSVVLASNDGFNSRVLKELTGSAKRVSFDEATMWVELNDARTIGVPLAWFPRLLHASTEQLNSYELSPRGIHWDALDEDISIAGLLEGRGDVTHRPHKVA